MSRNFAKSDKRKKPQKQSGRTYTEKSKLHLNKSSISTKREDDFASFLSEHQRLLDKYSKRGFSPRKHSRIDFDDSGLDDSGVMQKKPKKDYAGKKSDETTVQIEELKQQLELSKKEVLKLNADLEKAKEDVGDLSDYNTKLQLKLDIAEKKVTDLKAKLVPFQNIAEEYTAHLADVHQKFEAAVQTISKLEKDLEQARGAKQMTEVQLSKNRKALDNFNSQIAHLQNELQAAKHENAQLKASSGQSGQNCGTNVITQQTHSVEQLKEQAKIKRQEGFFVEAIDLYSKAIKVEESRQKRVSSKIAPVLIDLSECYAAMKQYQDALQAMNKACMYSPSSSNAYYLRATYYLELGDRSMTIKDLNRAIDLTPYHQKAKALLAKLEHH